MCKTIFILVGEKSGDVLGAHLIKAFKKRLPHYQITGVGGSSMRKEDFKAFMNTEAFEVIGFSQILASYLKIRKQFHQILREILSIQPKFVIFVDYPGFNLRMARALKKAGYLGKLIQYVSPTVWAWGRHRIGFMEKYLNLLFVVYPFEKDCFQESSLEVHYVGNPVRQIVAQHRYVDNWRQTFGIDPSNPLIALFPGSRKAEVKLNLPTQLKVAEKIQEKYPETGFVISCAHEAIISVMHAQLYNHPTLQLNRNIFLLPRMLSYELMRDCHGALAKAGIVTLELALHQCPTVVMYRMNRFNRFAAKYLLRLKLPYFCIANIISQEQIFPECIVEKISPTDLYKECISLYEGSKRNRCREGCRKLLNLLHLENVNENIVHIIAQAAESRS